MDPADAEAAPQGSIDDSESDAEDSEEDGVQPGVEILLDEALADPEGVLQRRQGLIGAIWEAAPEFLSDPQLQPKYCDALLALGRAEPIEAPGTIVMLLAYFNQIQARHIINELNWRMGCKALDTAVRCAAIDESCMRTARKDFYQASHFFLRAAVSRWVWAGGCGPAAASRAALERLTSNSYLAEHAAAHRCALPAGLPACRPGA